MEIDGRKTDQNGIDLIHRSQKQITETKIKNITILEEMQQETKLFS